WFCRYQSYNLLTEMVDPQGGRTRYRHTPAAELCEVIGPNGNRTEYVYDRCDRIIAVRHNGTLKESYERDAEGRLLTKRGTADDVLATLEYGVGDQPEIRAITQDGRLIESTYEYNPRGELLAAKNAFADVARDYDDAGRLLSEEINGQGVNHRYDEQG